MCLGYLCKIYVHFFLITERLLDLDFLVFFPFEGGGRRQQLVAAD